MIKKGYTLIKLPSNLKDSILPQIIPERHSIESQINELILEILDNNRSPSDFTTILTKFSTLNRQTLIKSWNYCIKIQLDKFCNKISCLIALKKSNRDMLVMSISDRIDKFLYVLDVLIRQISQRNKWCLCLKQECENGYFFQLVSKRVKKYCSIQLKDAEIVSQIFEQNLLNNIEVYLEFLSSGGNQDCNMTTLTKIQADYHTKNNNIEQNIKSPTNDINQSHISTQFLNNLKIDKPNRENCTISHEWIQSLKFRFL